MGGIRTAGDLVAWMQLTRRMKIDEAKTYVARKLSVDTSDLTDESAMFLKREAFGIGSVIPDHVEYTGIAAKTKIARLLDISIHSVDLYLKHIGAR